MNMNLIVSPNHEERLNYLYGLVGPKLTHKYFSRYRNEATHIGDFFYWAGAHSYISLETFYMGVLNLDQIPYIRMEPWRDN